MEKQENQNVEKFVKIVTQLSPASLQMLQSNAEVLHARDQLEKQEKEQLVQR